VKVDLDDILAGEAVRFGEEDGKPGVDDLAGSVSDGTPPQGLGGASKGRGR